MTTIDTKTRLACATCGESDNIQAWYDVPESQGIDLGAVGEDGRVEYDYNGCTKAGDGASENHGYYCSGCCTYDDSLESLLGLPKVEPERISDDDAIGRLAAYLRDTPDWNGGDFCDLAASTIRATGRSLDADVAEVTS